MIDMHEIGHVVMDIFFFFSVCRGPLHLDLLYRSYIAISSLDVIFHVNYLCFLRLIFMISTFWRSVNLVENMIHHKSRISELHDSAGIVWHFLLMSAKYYDILIYIKSQVEFFVNFVQYFKFWKSVTNKHIRGIYVMKD